MLTNDHVIKKDARSVSLEIDCPPDIPPCKRPENLDESEKIQYTVHFFTATIAPIRVSVRQQPSRPATPPRITQGTQGRTAITQQQAVNLINTWLSAKKVISAPPYNRDRAAEITTGKLYKEIVGESGRINWLKRNNAYYRYGLQKIEEVE